jgi:Tol biopolymer transport system component
VRCSERAGAVRRLLALTLFALVSVAAGGGSDKASRIAYTCGTPNEICVMNADGTHVRRLTHGPSRNEAPSWSPNGKRIAFHSDRDGNSEIYAMNADGSDQRRLTNSPWNEAAPKWSPDGATLAYVSDRGGNVEIYVMNVDGTRQVNLTKSPARDFDPAWVPNTRAFAFASDRDGKVEVYLMDERGQVAKYSSGGAFAPAISPDTSKLAVTGPNGIYVTKFTGGPWRRLTLGGWDTEPTWSPNGKKIAFRRGKNGPGAEIYVIDADGTGLRRLTKDSVPDGLPDWSPLPGG